FFVTRRPPPRSPLFPYTTLFRSHRWSGRVMFATCFALAGTPPHLSMALGAPPSVLLPVLVLSGLAAGALNPMMSTAMYGQVPDRSEEHTSELQSRENLVCRLLLE